MTDGTKYKFINDCKQAIIVSRMRDETSGDPMRTDIDSTFAFGVMSTTTTTDEHGNEVTTEAREHDYSLTVSYQDQDSQDLPWLEVQGHTLTIVADNLPSDPDSTTTGLVIDVTAEMTEGAAPNPVTQALVIPVTSAVLENDYTTIDDNHVTLHADSSKTHVKKVQVQRLDNDTTVDIVPDATFACPPFVSWHLGHDNLAPYKPDDDNRPAYLMCSLTAGS